jgi:cell wall-associated NlpC family hydrolase
MNTSWQLRDGVLQQLSKYQGVGMDISRSTLQSAPTLALQLQRRQWLAGAGIGAVALLLAGCGSPPRRSSAGIRRGAGSIPGGSRPGIASIHSLQLNANRREEAVARAMLAINAPYRFGGNTLDTGFDCSGLVQYVFSGFSDQVLPRSTMQWAQASRPVDENRLQRGDLVFFNTSGAVFSHMGIYIGGRQFVHAPSSGKVVSTESLDKNYYLLRFNGARAVFSA